MATGNFIDYVKVFIRSGNGGAGSKHFFRSKNTPKGGPDGGDGGRGVAAVTDAGTETGVYGKNHKQIIITAVDTAEAQ